MTKPKYVFFQRWRLFLFGMSNALKSGLSDNQAEKATRKELAELSVECLSACQNKKQEAMIVKLETLLKPTNKKSVLDQMLEGTHKDVPEWLRK